MTILFDPQLSERDFSSHLLFVSELLHWTKSKGLHLSTTPPISAFDFVQFEALLCAIERNSSEVSPEQALKIVLNYPVLKNDPALQKYPDDIDPITCRWLLGAEAHRKWRELLTQAITAHELVMLDFGSKLPIDAVLKPATAPVVSDTKPAAKSSTAANNWCHLARDYATEAWHDRPANTNPSKEDIANKVRLRFQEEGIQSVRGPLSAATIVREALTSWNKPRQSGKPGVPV